MRSGVNLCPWSLVMRKLSYSLSKARMKRNLITNWSRDHQWSFKFVLYRKLDLGTTGCHMHHMHHMHRMHHQLSVVVVSVPNGNIGYRAITYFTALIAEHNR